MASIVNFFAKQATLMRKSTVLSHRPQLVFPGQSNGRRSVELHSTKCRGTHKKFQEKFRYFSIVQTISKVSIFLLKIDKVWPTFSSPSRLIS